VPGLTVARACVREPAPARRRPAGASR
jgi:hypothetical protein